MADVSVPCWDAVDVEELCEEAELIAFDLDSTLARSKKPMKDDMANIFSILTSLIDVAVITGGKYALLQSQVVDRLTGQANRSKLHLMPTSGTRYYRWDGRRWTLVFAHDLSDEERAKAKESLERNAREQGIWSDYAWGERIEDRGSQITFSALGQSAPIEAKEAWDPTDEKKRRLARAVAAELPELEVRPGGASSVDISQRGVDKSFAVRELADILGMEVGRIVFIGDRMEPGGNDYPAAMAGTRAVKVTGPADTVRLCDGIVACLSR
ncbi:HAD-IIB family hydrolase [uncultured Bifidobacterium sp.]|uniref:HAD-IIB family hydrolase n=1 Tax=uncultured Bifidobacterium sp. TaxID=165187 RepID=UPI00280A5DA0|nr:HAD-IIB family hydrolase [uncultured Bifidobacterium sp.]